MITIQLPFTQIFICEICGKKSDIQEELKFVCPDIPPEEKPDVLVNQEVGTYRPPYTSDKSEDLRYESSTVYRLFYSKPGESIFTYTGLKRLANPHTLCVVLATSWGRSGASRAWKPEDSSVSSIEMTYADFLLWREGNREKLETAGLVSPQRIKSRR